MLKYKITYNYKTMLLKFIKNGKWVWDTVIKRSTRLFCDRAAFEHSFTSTDTWKRKREKGEYINT